jgi:hypothetical protein
VVRAIAEAMFSEDGEVDPARLDAHVCEVDAFVGAASKTTRLAMRAALLLVRFAPVLLFVRLTTLERLAMRERVALLSRLERATTSSLSLAFIGWRTVMTFLFYEDASELRRLGYDDERRRHKRALPIAAAAGGFAPPLPQPLDPAVVLPAPLESGVRLKDSDPGEDGRSDGAQRAAQRAQEVA